MAIFTHVVRADFHNELRHFRHFEIWHFYRYRAKDLPSAELGPRAVRFSGLLDLVVKALRTKPALIQGGEPYDFPTQLTIVLATFVVAGLLRVPYYYPTFENIPIHTKYSAVRRMGIPLGPLVVTFLRWLARTYASKSILVFAPNSGARRNIREAGVPPERTSNLLYATWGVDLELFTPKRNGREPNLGENAILYVGRLTLSKGIDYLLQAFLAVTQIVPDARLFLIGEGEMVSEVREFAARHSTASSIHLLGPMPNHNLPPYFRAARVTASPSITTARWAEQVGMVNIQSMACGTPVVSTQSGAIPEFVENGRNGILVPERDSTALAEALLRLLTDRQLQAHFAVNARAYAVQRYDASRNVAAVETMLVERMTALRRAASR